MAHLPSGRFASNSAWAICAAITHNLLRAAGTLSKDKLAVARGATLRRQIVNVPARLARPQRRPILHLPEHWPWAQRWRRSGTACSDPPPGHRSPPDPSTSRAGTTGEPIVEELDRPAVQACLAPAQTRTT